MSDAKRTRYHTRRVTSEHTGEAATSVFNTPYVARNIVQWAGISGNDARLITPGLSRLERTDPVFRGETVRLLDERTVQMGESKTVVKYWKVDGPYRTMVRRESLSTDHNDLSRLHVDLYRDGELYMSAAKRGDDIRSGQIHVYNNDEGGQTKILQFIVDPEDGTTAFNREEIKAEPYVRKNYPHDPALWADILAGRHMGN